MEIDPSNFKFNYGQSAPLANGVEKIGYGDNWYLDKYNGGIWTDLNKISGSYATNSFIDLDPNIMSSLGAGVPYSQERRPSVFNNAFNKLVSPIQDTLSATGSDILNRTFGINYGSTDGSLYTGAINHTTNGMVAANGFANDVTDTLLNINPGDSTEAVNNENLLGSAVNGGVAKQPIYNFDYERLLRDSASSGGNQSTFAVTSPLTGRTEIFNTAEGADDYRNTLLKNEMASKWNAKDILGTSTAGLNALTGMYEAWLSKKSLGLAEDSFKENKKMARANLYNQAVVTNDAMATRQANRLSSGLSSQSVDDFIRLKGAKGTI